MKAVMRARLIDGSTENNQMTISVINLGDKRGNSAADEKAVTAAQNSLTVEGLAVKKINEIMHLIDDGNEIILKLVLDSHLTVVSDIKEAKINGIDIDFSEINEEEKEWQQRREKRKEANKASERFFLQLCAALIISALLISVIASFG